MAEIKKMGLREYHYLMGFLESKRGNHAKPLRTLTVLSNRVTGACQSTVTARIASISSAK